MTEDQLSLNDIMKSLVDTPKDIVQAALDVMQVLGLAIQVKPIVCIYKY
jgi:hypothetical protein